MRWAAVGEDEGGVIETAAAKGTASASPRATFGVSHKIDVNGLAPVEHSAKGGAEPVRLRGVLSRASCYKRASAICCKGASTVASGLRSVGGLRRQSACTERVGEEKRHSAAGERRNSEERRKDEGEKLLMQHLERWGRNRHLESVIDPDGRFVRYWVLLQAVLAAYQFVSVTACVAFTPTHTFSVDTKFYIDQVADLLLLAHVLLQFRVGYVDPNNNKVMQRRAIQQHYLRSRVLPMHMLALAPLDLLQLMQWQVAPVYRFNKAARLFELFTFSASNFSLLRLLQTGFRVRIHVRRLLHLVLLVLLCAHVFACVFFLVGATSLSLGVLTREGALEEVVYTAATREAIASGVYELKWTNSSFFLALFDPMRDDSILAHPSLTRSEVTHDEMMQYLDSLYYSLGLMTGLADGETPQTASEAGYTIMVMLSGLFLLSTIVGAVSTTVDELSENKSAFRTKLLYVARMLKQHKLPDEIEDRVVNFYTYQWKAHRGFDDFLMLLQLPAGLRVDVLMQLTRTMIEKVPFFKGADAGFVRSLVDRLRPQIASAGEIMTKAGELSHKMYFVHRGVLDVLVSNPPVIVAKLRQGNYFGEAVLVQQPRYNTVQASTFCDLFSLTKLALTEVLAYYPEVELRLREIVRKRVAEDQRKEREAQLINKFGKRWIHVRNSATRGREQGPRTETPIAMGPAMRLAYVASTGCRVHRSGQRFLNCAKRRMHTRVAPAADDVRLAVAPALLAGSAIATPLLAGPAPQPSLTDTTAHVAMPISAAATNTGQLPDTSTANAVSVADGFSKSHYAARGATSLCERRAQVGQPGPVPARLLGVGDTSSPKPPSGVATNANSEREFGTQSCHSALEQGASLAVASLIKCWRPESSPTSKASSASSKAPAEAPSGLRQMKKDSRMRGAPRQRRTRHWLRAVGVIRSRSTAGSTKGGSSLGATYHLVLLPQGLLRLCELTLLLLCLGREMFTAPFAIAFKHDLAMPFVLEPLDWSLVALNLLADVVYLCDAAINRKLAFLDEQGLLVKDVRIIRRRFRRRGLVRVAVSLLPLDHLVPLLRYAAGVPADRLMLPLLRLPRLVQMHDFPLLAGELHAALFRSLKLRHNYSLASMAELLFVFLYGAHWITCVTTVVAQLCGQQLHMFNFMTTHDAGGAGRVVICDPWLRWLRTLYHVVSNLTGLGRDVKPRCKEEHFITFLLWLLGIFIGAYVIGSIGVLVSNFDAGEMRFNRLRNSVVRYLSAHRISNEIRARAFNYFEYKWAKTKGVDIQLVVQDFNNEALHVEVMSQICRDAVNSVPIFANRGSDFISSIVQVLAFQPFPQGEWLMRRGVIGSEMFFILKGEVDIIVDEELMFVTASCGVGDFVGEGALLQEQGRCNASVMARTSLDTMVLTRDGFAHVLQRYPEIHESIKQIGIARRKDAQAAITALDRHEREMKEKHEAQLRERLEQSIVEQAVRQNEHKLAHKRLKTGIKQIRDMNIVVKQFGHTVKVAHEARGEPSGIEPLLYSAAPEKSGKIGKESQSAACSLREARGCLHKGAIDSPACAWGGDGTQSGIRSRRRISINALLSRRCGGGNMALAPNPPSLRECKAAKTNLTPAGCGEPSRQCVEPAPRQCSSASEGESRASCTSMAWCSKDGVGTTAGAAINMASRRQSKSVMPCRRGSCLSAVSGGDPTAGVARRRSLIGGALVNAIVTPDEKQVCAEPYCDDY